MRVLLDSNVIVSAVATRGLCADVFRAVVSNNELVTCSQVLEEVQRILRTKFTVPDEAISEYLDILRQDAIIAEPMKVPKVRIKDTDDLAIIGAALAGKADVLVTGDSELLGLKHVRKLRILSPRAFWEELMARRGTAPGVQGGRP